MLEDEAAQLAGEGSAPIQGYPQAVGRAQLAHSGSISRANSVAASRNSSSTHGTGNDPQTVSRNPPVPAQGYLPTPASTPAAGAYPRQVRSSNTAPPVGWSGTANPPTGPDGQCVGPGIAAGHALPQAVNTPLLHHQSFFTDSPPQVHQPYPAEARQPGSSRASTMASDRFSSLGSVFGQEQDASHWNQRGGPATPSPYAQGNVYPTPQGHLPIQRNHLQGSPSNPRSPNPGVAPSSVTPTRQSMRSPNQTGTPPASQVPTPLTSTVQQRDYILERSSDGYRAYATSGSSSNSSSGTNSMSNVPVSNAG